MAGMLPGVECARRRRLRGSGGWCDSPSAVASAFGSAKIRVTHSTPPSFLQRSMADQSDEDDKLGGAAREAKERLDGRLRGHLKKQITRQNDRERLNGLRRRRGTTPMAMVENLQMEVVKSGLKRLGWLRWKSSDEAECAICLDGLKVGEKVAHLPCAHRFHSDCLLPWLESNTLCPCCRATVIGSS